MGHDGWPHPFVGGATHQLNPLKPIYRESQKLLSVAENRRHNSRDLRDDSRSSREPPECGKTKEILTAFPLFFYASFFFLLCPPRASQGDFHPPKSPLSATSNLLFLVEKRQLAGAGFLERFWTGPPHRNLFWRAGKGEQFQRF